MYLPYYFYFYFSLHMSLPNKTKCFCCFYAWSECYLSWSNIWLVIFSIPFQNIYMISNHIKNWKQKKIIYIEEILAARFSRAIQWFGSLDSIISIYYISFIHKYPLYVKYYSHLFGTVGDILRMILLIINAKYTLNSLTSVG